MYVVFIIKNKYKGYSKSDNCIFGDSIVWKEGTLVSSVLVSNPSMYTVLNFESSVIIMFLSERK